MFSIDLNSIVTPASNAQWNPYAMTQGNPYDMMQYGGGGSFGPYDTHYQPINPDIGDDDFDYSTDEYFAMNPIRLGAPSHDGGLSTLVEFADVSSMDDVHSALVAADLVFGGQPRQKPSYSLEGDVEEVMELAAAGRAPVKRPSGKPSLTPTGYYGDNAPPPPPEFTEGQGKTAALTGLSIKPPAVNSAAVQPRVFSLSYQELQRQQQQRQIQPSRPANPPVSAHYESSPPAPAYFDVLDTAPAPPAVTFSGIGLDFLSSQPAEPPICVSVELEHGDFEAYFHKVIQTPYVLYFIFDKRWKYGRFKPRQSKSMISIRVENETYTGMFWSEALFQLGELEITPFIIAADDEVEEKIADFPSDQSVK